MGNFYTNVTLRGPEQDEVLGALSGRKAFVSPRVNEYVLVYDERSEDQDKEVFRLATSLTRRFACLALAVLNHDDDVLWIRLYRSGAMIDEYLSDPGWPDNDRAPPRGGDSTLWAKSFGRGDPASIERILRGDYDLEFQRHRALVAELGLPVESCGWGFKYIVNGGSKAPFFSTGLKKTF